MPCTSPGRDDGCPVLLVEVGVIGNIEVAHEFMEVSPGGFRRRWKMIVHEDEGDEVHAVDINGSGAGDQETCSCHGRNGRYAVFRSLHKSRDNRHSHTESGEVGPWGNAKRNEEFMSIIKI
jgi:hypothetical protein